MRRDRWTKLLAGLAVLGADLVVAAPAAHAGEGTTFQGMVVVTAGGDASVSQGDDECSSGHCGVPGGSRAFCAPPALGAHLPARVGGVVTISAGTTMSCSAPWQVQSHLPPNTSFDVNAIYVDALSSSDVTIDDSEDCMTGAPNAIKVKSVITDSTGAFTTTAVLPAGRANSPGWYSGLCVSQSDGSCNYGSEVGIQMEPPGAPSDTQDAPQVGQTVYRVWGDRTRWNTVNIGPPATQEPLVLTSSA